MSYLSHLPDSSNSCISVGWNIWNSPYVQGQIISIFLASAGIFASLLSQSNANFPLFMSFLLYAALSIYFIHRICKAQSISFSHPWYLYFIIAVVDVEANYVMILAYNYTSMTSIALLDCFAIPCVVCLSYVFLTARYVMAHYIGATIAIIGMICTVLSDTIVSSSAEVDYPNALIGDMMVLLGASLYACSNVLQEKLVKDGDNYEYLGLLGVFGAGITLVQGLVLDLLSFLQCTWTWPTVLYLLGFSGMLVVMYTRTSIFLRDNDAFVFNLSLLTSGVYAVRAVGCCPSMSFVVCDRSVPSLSLLRYRTPYFSLYSNPSHV